MSTSSYPLSAVPGYFASRPGVQIGTQIPADAPDESLAFARQLGVEWVMTAVDGDEEHTADSYRRVVERFAEAGLKVYRLANHRCHNMDAVTLGLPNRDEKIEEYLQYLANLRAAGIRYATYAHMANGIWHSEREAIRGGAEARAFRIQSNPYGRWRATRYEGELTHERPYSESEIWDNYAYFIERVAPVAEELGIFIGIHPDDPPVGELGGVPRCIFSSYDGYKRALELADSPNIGVCLCVGCWLEGGAAMGVSVTDAIRSFAASEKLFKVHLRNVTQPLPEGFAETFLDDGYGDIVEILRALRDSGFDGAVISDHRPTMVGGGYAAEAYAVGYIRAALQALAADS